MTPICDDVSMEFVLADPNRDCYDVSAPGRTKPGRLINNRRMHWLCSHSHTTPASEGDNMAKSTCPVSRAEFLRDAQPVEVTINGIPMTAEVKEFSTGSLGWYLNGKANVKVGDKSVSVQIGMNLTIVGSKELPEALAGLLIPRAARSLPSLAPPPL